MDEVLPIEGLLVAVDASGTAAECDDDSGLLELSPASAEQVTIQIRTMVERVWEYIAIAYQCRAYRALGYRTWDEYVDNRLSDLRLTVPREERAEAVTTMSNARMSVRAIAKVLGVGVGTVHRGLAGEAGAADDKNMATIQGRDGKTYRRRAKDVPARQCSVCGEAHPDTPDGCPWDLFAQGLGPRPGSGQRPVDDPFEHVEPAQDDEVDEPQHEREDAALATPAVIQAVTRAVCIVDELDVLPQLIDDIESVGGRIGWPRDEPSLIDGVHELVDRLRFQFDVLSILLERLERFAMALGDPVAGSPAHHARVDPPRASVV